MSFIGDLIVHRILDLLEKAQIKIIWTLNKVKIFMKLTLVPIFSEPYNKDIERVLIAN